MASRGTPQLNFIKNMTRQHISMMPPDYKEQREDMHLLVWRDLPHWTIIDDDLYTFLGRINGNTSLEEVIASEPSWRRNKPDILKAIKVFQERGIIRFTDTGSYEITPAVDPRMENIAVNVTNRCNLQCRFCYNSGLHDRKRSEELAVTEIISFLDKTRPLLSENPSLSILGGEPLLVPETSLALADYGKRNGYRTILSTNGTLITTQFAKKAKQSDLQVQVSLDGATAAVNDMVRGNGSFTRTLTGIELLTKAGSYTILSMVCHDCNIHELTAFYELAFHLNVNEARFIPLKRIGAAMRCGLESPNISALITQAATMFMEHPEFKRLSGRDAFSILSSTCQYSLKRRSCGTGLQTVLLDCTGDVFPCANLTHANLLIGNIRDKAFDLEMAWRSSPVLRTVRNDTSVDDRSNCCCDCPVKYWCLGGCRGETMSVHRNMRKRAWNCAEQRRSILDLFWILAKMPNLVKKSAQFE